MAGVFDADRSSSGRRQRSAVQGCHGRGCQINVAVFDESYRLLGLIQHLELLKSWLFAEEDDQLAFVDSVAQIAHQQSIAGHSVGNDKLTTLLITLSNSEGL